MSDALLPSYKVTSGQQRERQSIAHESDQNRAVFRTS